MAAFAAFSEAAAHFKAQSQILLLGVKMCGQHNTGSADFVWSILEAKLIDY